jgi:TPR repeat protein
MTATESIYYDADPEEARLQLLELAASGDHEAEFYLGHLEEESSPPNAIEALTWYRKAAEGGFLEAKHWVASFLYHGIGTAQDLPAAVSLLRECAEAGLDASQWKLGQHLLQFPASRAEALRWLKLAAGQGHTGATELLAEAGECDV